MSTGRNISRWLLEEPIAHRGLYANPDVPENSLPALRAAIHAGFPIELDVHLLADKQPAVFHDRDLRRMTGAEGRIEAYDAQTLGALRLLNTEQTIPLLADALRTIGGAVPVLIELKSTHFRVGELERAVLRELEDYKGPFAVQSFNALSIRYFRRYAPAVCRGQLSIGHFDALFTRLAAPDFIACSVDSLSEGRATRLRRFGAGLLAWTITNAAQCAKAKTFADNYIFEATPGFLPRPLCAERQASDG